jgi:hypothetical protein
MELLANYISKNKNNTVKLENDDDFSKSIHFDRVHSENYLRCLFNVVTDGMNYRFSHSCCSGKGIMFYG